ncbi:MAG: nitrite/sulfite reductase, partial [Pseudonocardiaceae bacterium]
TKARAAELITELEERIPDLDVPITVNVNGCPNSCARIQVADIGLKGQLVTDSGGNQVEGYQVHLGGGLGLDSGFGRKLRGHKVTSAELGDYVERLVRGYAAGHEPGERFAQWVSRAPESELR